ncbi:MAG TPA: hypothetical protein VJQ82_19120 [Terriglobales bacterium]|nr:hypothetical protein [Terriglobales bacterium]
MRTIKIVALVALCVLGVSLMLQAKPNQFGVADSRTINFQNPMRIGDVLLPVGEYQVLHTMEGDNHIMVFKQINAKTTPAEARVKCTLVPLNAKADQTQQIYVVNAANERVLHELIFRGDTAKHVF